MIKKTVILVMDGLGDRPIKEFGNKTPLEYANTPNFDKIVKKSQCGLMYSLGKGYRPGSDVSHLEIFGYPYKEYYTGRGPIEVAGLGIKLESGDVAFRGNFGTVDSEWNIIDRRVGRINDVTVFANAIDGIEIDGIKFIVKPGTAYRAGVVMRGNGLSSMITDADPHAEGEKIHEVKAKDTSKEAIFTAKTLNKFLKKAYEVLELLPENIERSKKGQLKANFLLVRGAGICPNLPKFVDKHGFNKACCIAGGGLYKGIGAFLGMDIIDVEGATALPNTNVEGKFNAAIKALETYDFIFLHVKPTDSLAEDGNYIGKKDFIERIDSAIPILDNLPEDTLLIVTADHSTSSALKAHTADPVPVMVCGEGIRTDDISKFGEREFSKGSLCFLEGKDLIPLVINAMGKLPLIGA